VRGAVDERDGVHVEALRGEAREREQRERGAADDLGVLGREERLAVAGAPAAPGTPGEVVVTVDENPYLPLLRYRTGDRARLVRRDGRTELHDLEGRSPVRYLRPAGTWVPSVGAAQHLQAHGMAAWQLHQAADGGVELDVVPDAPGSRGEEDARAAGAAVGRLLDRAVAVRAVRPDVLGAGRARRWSSDVPGGSA